MTREIRWCALFTPPFIENYFLSKWILNFGVVPLFFIFFLRVEPIFTFFLALLVSFLALLVLTLLNQTVLAPHAEGYPF